ncbi:hypothetical protein [Corynebacterium sp.]|uniref:hypothetical protein n=1 Tax=Corynebacterium sp. TaxID=1720 RepID=UPI003736EFD6
MHNSFHDTDATNALVAPRIPQMTRRAHRFAADAAVQEKPPTTPVVTDDSPHRPNRRPGRRTAPPFPETEPRS